MRPSRRIAMSVLVAAVFSVASLTGARAATVTGVSEPGKAVAVYDSPAPDNPPTTTLPPTGFPWQVVAKAKGFYRVRVGNVEGWVKSMDVRVAQDVNAVCTTGPANAHVAGTLGAGSDRCK